jgi:hypothetical protein
VSKFHLKRNLTDLLSRNRERHHISLNSGLRSSNRVKKEELPATLRPVIAVTQIAFAHRAKRMLLVTPRPASRTLLLLQSVGGLWVIVTSCSAVIR